MKVDLSVVGPAAVSGLILVVLFVFFGYMAGYDTGHKEATYQQRIRCMEEQGKY